MRGLEALNLALFVPWTFAVAIAVLPGLGATGARRLRCVATLATTLLAAALLLTLPSATQPSWMLRGPWIEDWAMPFELALDAWRANAFLGLGLFASIVALLDRRSSRAASAVFCASFGAAVGCVLAGPPSTALPFVAAILGSPFALALCAPDERRAAPLLRLGMRALLAATVFSIVEAGALWAEGPAAEGLADWRAAALLLILALAVPLDRRPWGELRDRLGAAPAAAVLGTLAITVPLTAMRWAAHRTPELLSRAGPMLTMGLLALALALSLRALSQASVRDRGLDLQRAWITVALALLAQGESAAASWALALLIFVPIAGLLLDGAVDSTRRALTAGLLLIGAPPGVAHLLGLQTLTEWREQAATPVALLIAVWLFSAIAVLRPSPTSTSPAGPRRPLAWVLLGVCWSLQLSAALAPGWAEDLRRSAGRHLEEVELARWRDREATP